MLEDKTFIENALKTFTEKAQPKHILEIISEDLLKMLLDSYRFPLQTVLTVYFSKSIPADVATISWLELTDQKEETKLNSPFCYIYRHIPPECEKDWKLCDINITLKYYNKVWQGPKLFLRNLRLWDMTYPLFIGGRLVGVLYGGQIVVTELVKDWRAALKDLENEVSWQPSINDQDGEIPQKSNQTDEILIAINKAKELTADKKKKLKDLLDREKEKKVSVNDLLERYRKFRHFGEMLTQVFGDLYSSKAEAATRQLTQVIAQYLAGADLSSRRNWAERCGELFLNFRAASNIKDIHVYSRSHSNYELTVPYEETKRKAIRARDILPLVPSEQLINLKDEDQKRKALLATFGLGTEDVWLFRTENNAEPSMLACLMVMKGKLEKENQRLIEYFCRTIGSCNDVASLVFRLKEQQEAFKLKVAEVAHSFRTPLQSLIFDIENIEKATANNEEMAELRDLLYQSKIRLFGAREDVRNLLEDVKDRSEPYNLVTLVEEVMNDLQSAASAHPCLLIRHGNWPEEVIVKINKNKIQHALSGLIDNAIKYSWCGKTEDGIKKLHEVKVCVDASGYDMTMIRITNYGIGIPPDLLKSTLEFGKRGMVYDPKRERPGTGLGIPIADYILKEHGGHLEMDSYPADSNPRGPKEKYHHYITEVRLYLPKYE